MGETDDRAWLSSAGERLRDARIAAGISLDDAAEQTKISARQLSAIEEGDWTRLPAPVYVRGFIRIYARFLGISDPLPRTGEMPPATAPPRLTSRSARKRVYGKLIVPGLLLLSMVILSLFYDDTPPPVSRQTPHPPPLSVSAPSLPNRSTASPAAVRHAGEVAAESDGTQPPAPDGTGVIFRLKVNEQCWLQVTIDDSISRQYDLQAGDLIEWKAGRVISLDLGNAGGVEAELNGSPLPPLGKRGEVVHLTFRADETGRSESLPPRPSER